jgi:hypothetical protein
MRADPLLVQRGGRARLGVEVDAGQRGPPGCAEGAVPHVQGAVIVAAEAQLVLGRQLLCDQLVVGVPADVVAHRAARLDPVGDPDVRQGPGLDGGLGHARLFCPADLSRADRVDRVARSRSWRRRR